MRVVLCPLVAFANVPPTCLAQAKLLSKKNFASRSRSLWRLASISYSASIMNILKKWNGLLRFAKKQDCPWPLPCALDLKVISMVFQTKFVPSEWPKLVPMLAVKDSLTYQNFHLVWNPEFVPVGICTNTPAKPGNWAAGTLEAVVDLRPITSEPSAKNLFLNVEADLARVQLKSTICGEPD